MLVPLYGFMQGDTLGLVVLVHDDDPVSEIAARLQQATSMRVAPGSNPIVYAHGRPLDPNLTVEAAGLVALDRVDVVVERR